MCRDHVQTDTTPVSRNYKAVSRLSVCVCVCVCEREREREREREIVRSYPA